MKWVKLALPPRARRRWLLITIRLSESSLAGTARTLVAVGTVSEVSMLATTRAAAPRSTLVAASAGTTTAGLARAGVGWSVGRVTGCSADRTATAGWPAPGWAGWRWPAGPGRPSLAGWRPAASPRR